MGDAPHLPRVLVVEDNCDIADLIARRLRLDGLEPVPCADPARVSTLLQEQVFDAVLLDIMMPAVDGFEVLRQIRAIATLDDLPVVMLTAKASPADREKAAAMGANAYVVKPFGPHDLVRTLRGLIARRAPAASPSPAS